MKAWIFSFILFCTTVLANGRPRILILNFVNQTPNSPHYDLLNENIGKEFRFIFSKSKSLEVLRIPKLYPSLVELQKQNYNKLADKIRLYLNSQSSTDYEYLLAGEFTAQGDKLEITYKLFQNQEGIQLVLEKKSSNSLSHWQFQACSEAVSLANFYFKESIYDEYIKKCKNPKLNSEILENTLSVYKKIQNLEKELFLSEISNSRSICAQQCYAEKSEIKSFQCLQTCDSSYMQEVQKLLSKIHVKGYKKLNPLPENPNSTWKNFKDEFLNLFVFILQSLPEGYKVSIQARISKDFSNHPKIFEISKQKAEHVKERLSQEILSLDKTYTELVDKLHVEACGDVCYSEYPLQLEENSVTFRIRKR